MRKSRDVQANQIREEREKRDHERKRGKNNNINNNNDNKNIGGIPFPYAESPRVN